MNSRPPASIDVVMPTYNRAALIPRAVETFLATRKPAGVAVRLVIVDNNSSDETRAVCAEAVARHSGVVCYLFEARQGRHFALNAGIMASRADVVAFFDDDETLDAAWVEVITREFSDAGTHFIGGPYFPNWLAPQPTWLPPGFDGVLGITRWGERRVRYGTPGFDGEVWGGNAAFRRQIFDEVGLYSTKFMYAEDTEMFRRLKGKYCGYYVPDLKIYHDIPERKLQKAYFRRWFYEHGVNMARLKREQEDGKAVRMLFGVPRWTVRKRIELRFRCWRLALRGDEVGAFTAELDARQLAVMRPDFRRPPVKSFGDRSGRNEQ